MDDFKYYIDDLMKIAINIKNLFDLRKDLNAKSYQIFDYS